ncbi:MAG: hypothetical protein AAF197_05075, partial [Pseudomonadota bacterium]
EVREVVAAQELADSSIQLIEDRETFEIWFAQYWQDAAVFEGTPERLLKPWYRAWAQKLLIDWFARYQSKIPSRSSDSNVQR